MRTLHHYHTRQRVLVAQWKQAKTNLVLHVRAVVAEAWQEWERKRMFEREKEEQLTLCRQLSEKVLLIFHHCVNHYLYSLSPPPPPPPSLPHLPGVFVASSETGVAAT